MTSTIEVPITGFCGGGFTSRRTPLSILADGDLLLIPRGHSREYQAVRTVKSIAVEFLRHALICKEENRPTGGCDLDVQDWLEANGLIVLEQLYASTYACVVPIFGVTAEGFRYLSDNEAPAEW